MKKIRMLLALVTVCALIVAIAAPAMATSEQTVSCTVQTDVISCSVDNPIADFGHIPFGEVGYANGAYTNYFHLTNNGNVVADYLFRGSDAVDGAGNTWTLGLIGTDSYELDVIDVDLPDSTNRALSTSDAQWLVRTAGWAPGSAANFQLGLYMPTSSTGTGAYSSYVTITAVTHL